MSLDETLLLFHLLGKNNRPLVLQFIERNQERYLFCLFCQWWLSWRAAIKETEPIPTLQLIFLTPLSVSSFSFCRSDQVVEFGQPFSDLLLIDAGTLAYYQQPQRDTSATKVLPCHIKAIDIDHGLNCSRYMGQS